MTTFNLVHEPWLPVRYLDGGTAELGLKAVFRDAPRIGELDISLALEWVATVRLLATVLLCVESGGPRSVKARARWLTDHEAAIGEVDAYLDQWEHRFDLFDSDRPFMQAPIGDDVADMTIAALRANWASGNNVTLFDHHVDRRPEPLKPGAAVRALLATLLFAPGGGVSKPFNRTDSPATKGLQVLIAGETLWETIVSNAPGFDAGARGCPYWELPAHDADRVDRRGTPSTGWLDRATWRSRAIRLLVDPDGLVRRVRMHQHLKVDESEGYDPYVPLRRPPGEPTTIMRPSPARAIWRDSETLFPGLSTAEGGRSTVAADALLSHRRAGRTGILGIRVVGQIVNQAKIADVRDARLPLSQQLIDDDEHVAVLAGLTKDASDAAVALRAGVRTANERRGMDDDWSAAARWETGYWAVLAPRFATIVDELARVEDGERAALTKIGLEWNAAVRRAAVENYARFASDGARSERAFVAIGQGEAVMRTRLARMTKREEAAS